MSRLNLSFAFLCFALFVIDISVKGLVFEALEGVESVEIIPGFFNLTLVKNYGFAFGILSDSSFAIKTLVGVFIVVIITYLSYIIFFKKNVDLASKFAFSAILSGGLGNLYDRLTLGYVRDFFDFHLKGMHWPAFNFADCYITLGLICIIAADLFKKKT